MKKLIAEWSRKFTVAAGLNVKHVTPEDLPKVLAGKRADIIIIDDLPMEA